MVFYEYGVFDKFIPDRAMASPEPTSSNKTKGLEQEEADWWKRLVPPIQQ